MTIINFNTATEKMDSQQYPNLSADEMAVVASIKKVGTVWTCKICNQAFETILPLVTHLLTACSDNNTFETSSAMKICMHFDPNDFRGIFEADRRLDPGSADDSTATEEDTSSESDEASTMGSSRDGLESRDSVELDDLDRELLGEDDSDDEQLQAGVKIASAAPVAIERDLSGDETDEDDLESQDSGKTPPAGSEFPATPPPWLSNKDRAEWRTRQDYHDKMKRLCAIHRTAKNNTDWVTVLSVWNTTYATRKEYNSYSGANTMNSRISRDKGMLLALQAKKPANWDATP